MKVKKSLRAIALALVVVFVLSSTAFAAIPNNTIIFNDKAYDLSLLDDPSMVNEILGAFVANHNTFIYKTPTGTFLNNNGNVVNSGVLPAVTYKDVNKNTTPYNAQDGDPVVQSVSITAITVDPAAVTVDNGTSKDVAIAQLSAKVTLTLSDNTTKDVDVTWDCATYDGAKAGDYAFNGTFTLPGGVTNPDAKVATAKVTVKDATVDLTATADVTKGAMSFKDINVKSCQGIDGAAKFKVAGSSLVNSFGTAIRVMNANDTIGISILAADGTTVLATGTLNISATAAGLVFSITATGNTPPPPPAKQATVSVVAGAMSFKDINVKSCQGIDGAAKFKVAGSSLVNSFGTAIRVMNGNPTVGISILAANGTTVLATGSVDISKTSVTDLTVNLQ